MVVLSKLKEMFIELRVGGGGGGLFVTSVTETFVTVTYVFT